MHSSAHNESPARDLERMATEWFFRRDGGFTADEARAFQRWLHQDEQHARVFAEIEDTWRALGAARNDVIREIARTAEQPRGRSAQRGRKLIWRPATLGAAAAIVIAGIGWLVASRLSEGGWRASTGDSVFAEQAATEIGGLRKMDLPDGSFVTLNTDTAVDVRFTAAERRVRLLRGEALFTVAKSLPRPFVVEAGGVVVKAVGTAFNVRLRPGTVEVLVTAGKVRVDDAARGQSLLAAPTPAASPATSEGDPARLLLPGEKVIIPLQINAAPMPATASAIAASEINQALAWQDRRLEYIDVPLSEIIADFNHYNQHRLVIADSALAGRRFGGTFPAGDYRSLVQLLEKSFGVRVERRNRETILRLP